MDNELKGKTKTREFDSVANDVAENENSEDEEVTEGAHVLNNLLQSLEASAGASGPMSNMLKEMGVEPPK